MRRLVPLLVALGIFVASAGCASTFPGTPTHADFTAAWVPVDSLTRALPDGARVYAYAQQDPPLRAWFVSVPRSERLRPSVAIAADTVTRRASTSAIAAENSACIAVNGGYFTMDAEPARHVGLLWLADTLHTSATFLEERPEARRPVRAALGIKPDGGAEVSWAGERGTVLLRHEASDTAPWPMRWALGAGPMILKSGEIAVEATEEGFARTSIPAVHPRTAAGVSADGDLILMVVDGRQPESRGVNLAELADLMRSAGAVDALNLDGGGSSTLVVNGHLLNRPTGGTFQRQVMSAIVVRCE